MEIDTKNEHDAPVLPTLLTLAQFCAANPAFSLGSLRWLVFNESINGLRESGAILRIGRRVLIDPALFFRWVMRQQHAQVAA